MEGPRRKLNLKYDHSTSIQARGEPPAYDVTITQLIDLEPNQDITLPVMGKRANLKRTDWVEFGNTLGLNAKAVENRFSHFQKKMPEFFEAIESSLLPGAQKEFLKEFVSGRMERIV